MQVTCFPHNERKEASTEIKRKHNVTLHNKSQYNSKGNNNKEKEEMLVKTKLIN